MTIHIHRIEKTVVEMKGRKHRQDFDETRDPHPDVPRNDVERLKIEPRTPEKLTNVEITQMIANSHHDHIPIKTLEEMTIQDQDHVPIPVRETGLVGVAVTVMRTSAGGEVRVEVMATRRTLEAHQGAVAEEIVTREAIGDRGDQGMYRGANTKKIGKKIRYRVF